MPTPAPIVLEYDKDMNRAENNLPDQTIVLNSTTGPLFRLPYGCYFTRSLVIRKMPGGQELRPGIDFTALHAQTAAMIDTGREVSTLVRIDLQNYEGTYSVDCHYIGGEYSTNVAVLQRLMDERQDELLTIHWNAIVGKPNEYNPAAHLHDIRTDVYGFDDLIGALNGIMNAIYNGGIPNVVQIYDQIALAKQEMAALTDTKIAEHNAASAVHSKSAIGLNKVGNYGLATIAQVNALDGGSLLAPQHMIEVFMRMTSSLASRVDPASVTDRAIRVVTWNIPEVEAVDNQYVLIQGNVADTNVVSAAMSRYQILIGITPPTGNFKGSLGAMLVRFRPVGNTAQWTPYVRLDSQRLNNVPNYPAADTSAANIQPGTSVTDKLVVPAVAGAIAREAIKAGNAQFGAASPAGAIGAMVSVTGLERNRTYLFTITGRFRQGSSIADAGTRVAILDSTGAVVGSQLFQGNVELGTGSGSSARSNPFSVTILAKTPDASNTTLRLVGDYDLQNVARGAVSSYQYVRVVGADGI